MNMTSLINEMDYREIDMAILYQKETDVIASAPLGAYVVILQGALGHATGQDVLATATNVRDQTTATALLSLEKTLLLLGHAYGERSIVNEYMDRLAAHESFELQATAKDPCIFKSQELVELGFDPDDLEL